MARTGKHLGLFYYGQVDKNSLRAIHKDQTKSDGSRISVVDAEAFHGDTDERFTHVVVESVVPEALAKRIEAAYKSVGAEVNISGQSFADAVAAHQTKQAEDGEQGGSLSDPPMSLTDNVTASRTSPQAHVETDGRNNPRQVRSGATGTSLDNFGQPLANTDRAGEGSDLAARAAAVKERTDAAAAAEGERASKAAEASQGAAKAGVEAKKAAADEARKAEEVQKKASAEAAKSDKK